MRRLNVLLFIGFCFTFLFELNAQVEGANSRSLSEEFKSFWYNGEAEISSFHLEQARYGEIHQGTAVLIYVTEPFSPIGQVKADKPTDKDISVLKLNFTKKFTTGIYPYSMMTSSFLPLNEKSHLIKLTSSSQEWCGHTFMQLNNRENYELTTFSYFQSEGDKNLQLKNDLLEDEIWNLIRISPNEIPTGRVAIIPSFFYLRLSHNEIKSYEATIHREVNNSGDGVVVILYPQLNRKLKIIYKKNFPFDILSWEETYRSGWGSSAQILTTKATRIKTLKLDYWNKNSVLDAKLRESLGLPAAQ